MLQVVNMNNIIEGLNPEQADAVLTDSKRVLILAGAGSGKTKTITARIVHLIRNENISSDQLLALTFTNKAAGEMRERIESSAGDVSGLLIKTFHSFGAYFLRRSSTAVDRKQNFIIYDQDDSKKIIDKILSEFEIIKQDFPEYRRNIQFFKQNLEDENSVNLPFFFDIYKKYEDTLRINNAFDFEDLILKTVKILESESGFSKYFKNRFKYILVDEYQDTNFSQYTMLNNLTGIDSNIMVVGDEDQSIYKFRGADLNIILNFPKDNPDTKIIRLEKNYRSTDNILSVANSIISNNYNRLGKKLFAVNGSGDSVKVIENRDDYGEAENAAKIIRNENLSYNKTAILVRTNNQTRVFEQIFMKYGMPFKIVAGVGFYEREEVKDCLSILRWISNNFDSVSFERFANKPSKGIGAKTMALFLTAVSLKYKGNILEALSDVSSINGIKGKSLDAFKKIYDILSLSEEILNYRKLSDSLEVILDKLGLLEYYLKTDKINNTDKISNIREFLMTLRNVEPGLDALTAYLEENALISQSDSLDDENSIKILTIHNAKGLEFDNVFICGIENDIFPHCNSISDDPDGIEEERRLFYVAITRARVKLYLMYCNSRMIFGTSKQTGISPFIKEIPEELIELIKIKKNDNNSSTNLLCCIGDMIKSNQYGVGRVISLRKSGRYDLALIDFFDYGEIEVILQFVKLEKIDD